MRIRRHLTVLGLLATLVLLLSPSGSQAFRPYPGLPEPSWTGQSGWRYIPQSGLSYSAKARQWVAVPVSTSAAWSGTTRVEDAPEPGVFSRTTFRGEAVMVSAPGAPDPYGHLPPLRVRTVGFGLLPVEATVQVSQRRENGLPIPTVAELVFDRLVHPGGAGRGHEVRVTDAFDVRVTEVLVDGVDIGLTGDCRTVRPAPVQLVGPGWEMPEGTVSPQEYLATLDPSEYYHPLLGGQLAGTLDLPPFTGCTTGDGDDLSPMITLSVSGPGNRAIFQTAICGNSFQNTQLPPAPWEYQPKDGCEPHDPLPYPERED